MTSQQSCRDMDRMQYMEAWLSGYNACRDGVTNDFDSIMAAVKESYENSGTQRGIRVADALTGEQR